MAKNMLKIIFVVSILSLMTLADDAALAPRASRLTGSAYEPSAKGVYIITFPSPNDCVDLGKIHAISRTEALYKAVSKGGFSLKPSDAGLSVWTIEEWDDFAKDNPDFLKEGEKRCAENR
jgi:hypothetical protein